MPWSLPKSLTSFLSSLCLAGFNPASLVLLSLWICKSYDLGFLYYLFLFPSDFWLDWLALPFRFQSKCYSHWKKMYFSWSLWLSAIVLFTSLWYIFPYREVSSIGTRTLSYSMLYFQCLGWSLVGSIDSVSCSVMSDSLWPHELQPARLLCPWDFPGKNTGVGSQPLLQGIFPFQELNPVSHIMDRFFTGLSHQRS